METKEESLIRVALARYKEASRIDPKLKGSMLETNIAQLTTKEIVTKLERNHFTDDSLTIALAILKDRQSSIKKTYDVVNLFGDAIYNFINNDCKTRSKPIPKNSSEQYLRGKLAIIQDLSVLTDWLGEDVCSLSENGRYKLKAAYLSYLLSPKSKGHSILKNSEVIRDISIWLGDYEKIPEPVFAVFERMFLPPPIQPPKKQKENYEKRKIFKWVSKFIAFNLLWAVWVLLRTGSDFELLGYYFRNWDNDMLFVNLAIGPLLSTAFLIWRAYKK